MGIPSGWELVILLAVLVLLFGATKLPTAARSIGQSIRIFKAETRGPRLKIRIVRVRRRPSSSPCRRQGRPPLRVSNPGTTTAPFADGEDR